MGRRLRLLCEELRVLRAFASKLLLFFAIIAIVLIIGSVAVWALAKSLLLWYFVILLAPALLAFATVLTSLYRSGYVKVATECGLKRDVKKRAGLALIHSKADKVLLNRQVDQPWKNMWCLPGGYFNPEEHDLTTRDTAQRRAKALTDVKWTCEAKIQIAVTNGSPAYSETELFEMVVVRRDSEKSCTRSRAYERDHSVFIRA
jgi:hypothetical protein